MAITYSEYQPTGFDPKGLGLEDRRNWLVAPVGLTRESDILSESNFASALRTLGGESETVEVHRFRHWAVGWFEIILVHPDREDEINEMEGALLDYPVLDESDWSEREYEAIQDYWDNMDLSDRVELCAENGESIFAARHNSPPLGDVYDYLRERV